MYTQIVFSEMQDNPHKKLKIFIFSYAEMFGYSNIDNCLISMIFN
jgi:hypothetical protein